MRASLLAFAHLADALAATTKKLQKQSLLADYLRALESDDDLRLAVRYLAGRPSGQHHDRVLNVGWSILSSAIIPLLKLDPTQYHTQAVRSGDIGEALAHLWPNPDDNNSIAIQPPDTDPGGRGSRRAAAANPPPADQSPSAPLTLHDLAAAFDDLADTGNQQSKRDILTRLFSRCASPREAAYLAKIIFSEMRTGVQEGVLQAGVAQAFDKTLPQIQRAQLLLGDLGQVAVLARHNTLDSAQFQLFHPIQFMLATARQTAHELADSAANRCFVAEDKLDGIRAQVHKAGPDIAIYTRTMDRADESFPDVVEQLRQIPGDFLLDGEIVPYENNQVLPFSHIQKRLGRKILTPAILRQNPAAFIAFDLLYLNGHLLLDLPLKDRRQRLESLSPPLLLTSPTPVCTPEEIQTYFDAARARRNEGVVLKDLDSPYTPGRRGLNWFKLKTHLPTVDCVVTAAEYGHGKRKNVLSDYTFAVWSTDPADPAAQLVNIGKAYSGVTDIEIAQLTELFLSIATHNNGRVFQVPPKVVLEIAADQIQKSNRHASGYALRFPRIKRIRWDKPPEQADHLDKILQIYQSLPNTAYHPTQPKPTPKPPDPTLFDHLP